MTVCAVSEATGQVVASTQSGLTLVRQESEAKMDYSKLSLTQAKRLEMESQVKALELEKELETERTRLAELRKVHYKLAGASEGWEEVRVCVCVLGLEELRACVCVGGVGVEGEVESLWECVYVCVYSHDCIVQLLQEQN